MVEKFLKMISALAPFLSAYPLWVRGVFALWILATALLLLGLLLAKRAHTGAHWTTLKEIPPHTTTAAHMDERELIVALAQYWEEESGRTGEGDNRVVSVLRTETTPFKANYKGFRFLARPRSAIVFRGLGFLIRNDQLMSQLPMQQRDRALELSVPAAEKDDRLLVILRIETTQSLDDPGLRTYVSLERIDESEEISD